MKRVLLLLLLYMGIYPCLKNHNLSFSCTGTLHAQAMMTAMDSEDPDDGGGGNGGSDGGSGGSGGGGGGGNTPLPTISISINNQSVRPGDNVLLTVTATSGSFPSSATFTFYGWMTGDQPNAISDINTAASTFSFRIPVLGTCNFKASMAYTNSDGTTGSISSNTVTIISQLSLTDLTTLFSANMNTAWANTLANPTGEREDAFYALFDGTTSRVQETTFVTQACQPGEIGTSFTISYPPPYVGLYFAVPPNVTWPIFMFHTHPPLVNCMGTVTSTTNPDGSTTYHILNINRPVGPSTIDNANVNGKFPHVVRDYSSGPVIAPLPAFGSQPANPGTPLNAPFTDYPYDVNATHY